MPLLGIDGLETELGNTLLPPALADRRRRPFAAEVRAGSGRVPGAVLVLADPPGPRVEERRPHLSSALAGQDTTSFLFMSSTTYSHPVAADPNAGK